VHIPDDVERVDRPETNLGTPRGRPDRRVVPVLLAAERAVGEGERAVGRPQEHGGMDAPGDRREAEYGSGGIGRAGTPHGRCTSTDLKETLLLFGGEPTHLDRVARLTHV
jgi:hypothetical protein